MIIAGERGELDLHARLGSLGDEAIAISAITATELLHGIHRMKGTTKKAQQEAYVEGLLAAIPVLTFDLRAARVHARIWAKLLQSGQMVGERDLFIAATAIAHGFGVISCDKRSFPRIPGLDVTLW